MGMFLLGMTAGATVVLFVILIVVKMNEKDRQKAEISLTKMCVESRLKSGTAEWTAADVSRRVDELASKVSNVEARTDNLLTYVDDAIGSHEGLYHIPDPKPVKKDKKK